MPIVGVGTSFVCLPRFRDEILHFDDFLWNPFNIQSGADAEQPVIDAIDIGYRHVDTAYRYGSEKQVGKAIQNKIAEGVINREDVFVTTKVNTQ